TGNNGCLLPMARSGSIGWANANMVTDAVYVDSSNRPAPHGGNRELMEACSGPAKLAGPTGPDRFQAPRLRSVSRTITLAMPLASSVWMAKLFSVIGSNRLVR